MILLQPAKLWSIHQVVLPKPSHASYEIPNSYRPIALIETIAKVLSMIVTEDLSYECKTNNILPEHQFGRRPGWSTINTLHYAEQYIKNSWHKGRVIAALFLNIQAAFLNMQKEKLLKNMQARNIAHEYSDYVDMILTQQQIQLKFNNHISTPFSPENRCCQGCPLLMLLYALYNAPLIQVADNNNPNECIIGYVDDTTLLASRGDFNKAYDTLKNMMERANGVFNWSKSYNSPLEMNKLALINFTMSSEKANNKTLILNYMHGNVQDTFWIRPSPHVKLLGVILDSQLTWATHHEKVCKKAVKWTSAFKCFTKAASGIRMNKARKLYNTVAVPKITYTADIWFCPKKAINSDKNPLGFGPLLLTKWLDSIQRQVAISITGALCTAPGDALIVHANLMPMGVLLKEACLKAYTWLLTHPVIHPINATLHWTAKLQVKMHCTLLHHLARTLGIKPGKVEKIGLMRFQPGEHHKFSTSIALMKEASISDDKWMFCRGTMIYTDSSGYKEHIGASAILFTNGRRTEELQYRLGPDTQHTVFEGELVAIILGLHLTHTINGTCEHINLNINNQATIKMMHSNNPQSAQYLINKIKNDIIRLHNKETTRREWLNISNQSEMEVTLTWIAGHMGSVGNEVADELAKEAVEHRLSNADELPHFLHKQLPIGLSSIKQQIDSKRKVETRAWWTCSKCYNRIKSINPSFPSMRFIMATLGLNWKHTSTLTQLCTDHILLNGYLCWINKTVSPNCPNCLGVTENMNHYLFFCHKYNLQRHKLILTLKHKPFIKKFILTDKSTIWHTLNYINETRRFRHIYRDINMELIEDNEQE